MSYFTGRPKGALPAIVPGFGGVGCSCTPTGADPELAQRLPIVAVAAVAGIVAGFFLSRQKRA